MLSVVILNVLMLSVVYTECHYAKFRYTECRCAESLGALLNDYIQNILCSILDHCCQPMLSLPVFENKQKILIKDEET